MSTDPNIIDRRQELGYHHLPEGFKEAADENGNIVLEVRTRPRLDAMGRPLSSYPEPDELEPFLARTKVKTSGLPTYTGESAIAYVAHLAGLRSVAKAVERGEAAERAWDATQAQLRDARAELKAFERDQRTTAAVSMNQGETFTMTPALIKKHRELADKVAAFEGIFDEKPRPGMQRERMRARPTGVFTAIVSDEIASLDFDQVSDLMYATMIVSTTQAARHQAGLPPAALPVKTLEVMNMIFGTLPGNASWMRQNPDSRKRLTRLRRQLGPVMDELRKNAVSETRERMLAAA